MLSEAQRQVLRLMHMAHIDPSFDSAVWFVSTFQKGYVMAIHSTSNPEHHSTKISQACSRNDIARLLELGYIDVTGIPEHYVITVEGLLVVGIHGTRPDVKGATVATSNPIGQVRVFIGHGRDPQWRELAEFLRRSGKCDVFYYESDASVGSTTIETLNSLLNKAEIAFLVHTAEDEAKDQFRARENVVHEAGLFQGKLGFSRALILLEEGCNEYSNIRGLNQIRFKKGQIGTTFGEVLVKINNEFAR